MFASRALSESEKNYSASKRKLLGVVWAIENFGNYVFGRNFTPFTDHHALRFLFSQRHTNHMMAKWFDILTSYEFDVVHVRGRDNVVADGLIRMHESIKFNNMTVDHFVRGKNPPDSNEHKKELIRNAHSFGHFGSQEVLEEGSPY